MNFYLIEARRRKGLTQKALAESVGMDFRHISLTERGRYVPTITERGLIADILETDYETLWDSKKYFEI